MIQRRKKREQPFKIPLVSRIEQFRTTAPVGQSGRQWVKEKRNAP